jgi:peptide deformylase
MAIQRILQLGDPTLRQVSRPVEDLAAARSTAADLVDTLRDCRQRTGYGRAICAVQIGQLERVIVVDLDSDLFPRPWVLVDPSIVERSEGTMEVWDACLSFLTIFFKVTRHEWIRVRCRDLEGAWREVRLDGDLAELLQHELDHLDGVLAIDRMTDVRTMCTREEFEQRHREQSPYATA